MKMHIGCEVRELPLKIKLRQIFATVCLGAISLGATLSWTSPVLPQFQISNATLYLNEEEKSWVGSTLAIGCLISAVPAGYLADQFGRKIMLISLVVPFVAFCLLAIFADNVYYLYVGRLISGMCAGGVAAISPMYMGEISDSHFRGILGTLFECLIYVGVLICSILGAYVHFITLTGILGAIAVVLGLCFAFFPESPTYLIKNGMREKAEEALKFYRGENYDVSLELSLIQKQLEDDASRKISIWSMLKSKATIRGLVACVGITFFQQFSAVATMIFYCVDIFKTAGTDLDPYTSSVVVSVVQLLSCTFVIFVIEKFDRRIYLFISVAGVGTSLLLLGAYFQLKQNGIVFYGLDAIPLISVVTFFIYFSLGLGPIPWLINSELFPTEVKGLANGITISSNWSMMFVVTLTFPIMLEKLRPENVFFLYAAFMAFGLIFIKFFIPETRGKTLIQIQKELNS